MIKHYQIELQSDHFLNLMIKKDEARLFFSDNPSDTTSDYIITVPDFNDIINYDGNNNAFIYYDFELNTFVKNKPYEFMKFYLLDFKERDQ